MTVKIPCNNIEKEIDENLRLRQQCKTKKFCCRGSRLSPWPYENECRYRNVRPHSPPAESHSFVGMARETAAMPPADLVHIRNIQRPNRSFSSVQMFHTHTQAPMGSRVLWHLLVDGPTCVYLFAGTAISSFWRLPSLANWWSALLWLAAALQLLLLRPCAGTWAAASAKELFYPGSLFLFHWPAVLNRGHRHHPGIGSCTSAIFATAGQSALLHNFADHLSGPFHLFWVFWE